MWDDNFFKVLGGKFGTFVDFDEETACRKRLDVARIKISTDRWKFIDEVVAIKVVGVVFNLWVVEDRRVDGRKVEEEGGREEGGSLVFGDDRRGEEPEDVFSGEECGSSGEAEGDSEEGEEEDDVGAPDSLPVRVDIGVQPSTFLMGQKEGDASQLLGANSLLRYVSPSEPIVAGHMGPVGSLGGDLSGKGGDPLMLSPRQQASRDCEGCTADARERVGETQVECGPHALAFLEREESTNVGTGPGQVGMELGVENSFIANGPLVVVGGV